MGLETIVWTIHMYSGPTKDSVCNRGNKRGNKKATEIFSNAQRREGRMILEKKKKRKKILS